MPEQTRRAVAFFGALAVALSIFLVWLVGVRAHQTTKQSDQSTAIASVSAEFSPVASLKRGFGEFLKGIGKQAGESKMFEGNTTETSTTISE